MTDDQVLVRRAQAGDVDAFERLVQRHIDMTYRVALRIVRNAEDAQDVSQRALLSAWRGLPTFRGDAAFSSWLHQIVRRHALNCVNRNRQANWVPYGLEHADPARGPAAAAEAAADVDGLRRAVAALPMLQQQALRLHHFEGRSYREISAATGSTVPAVRSHLYRARQALAGAMAAQN